MQPLAEVTLTRPWHWGVAVLGDALAEVPGSLAGQAVVVGDGVVAIGVRHAQDIDAERFEGDWDWATATFHVRSLGQAQPVERHVLCDIVIATPNETVSLGDADGMVVIPAPSLRTRVVVSADQLDLTGLDDVWVDLVAVDG
jgi:hypothetical protein